MESRSGSAAARTLAPFPVFAAVLAVAVVLLAAATAPLAYETSQW